MKKIVLLSIFPKWADAILDGRKKWEYRRIPPKTDVGSLVVLFASRERQEIVGEFIIGEILRGPLNQLINQTVHETPHTESELLSYFSGLSEGTALRVDHQKRYAKPITLDEIQKAVPNFVPPQSFTYIYPNDAKKKPILDMLPRTPPVSDIQPVLF